MAIVDEARALATRVPRPPGEALPPGTTDAELRGFTARTGISMPSDLVEWLLFTNGACIGPGGVHGIKCTRQNLDIENLYAVYPEWRTRGWIPVAADGTGGYFVIDSRREGTNPVFFVDTSLDAETLSFVCASDLWHFLRFLFRRELGERGWPFAKEYVLQEDPTMKEELGAPKPWDVP